MSLVDLYTANKTSLDDIKVDTSTKYPSANTGKPTTQANPGASTPFLQPYSNTKTYMSVIHDQLVNTPAITNLDVENPGVNGGPAKPSSDPTRYPSLVTGTPTTTKNPGGPVKKFNQKWLPKVPYLNTNPIAIPGSGKLDNILPITNLDVENKGVQGGPAKPVNDPTKYPSLVTGTPTYLNNPIPTKKFNQIYLPASTYLSKNAIATPSSGILRNTLSATNLDVDDPKPAGGIPYKPANDPTVYPAITTGTPTGNANPAGPAQKFNQIYNPYTLYLTSNPIAGLKSGILRATLPITNLDIEDPGFAGGPANPNFDPTVYPITVTGTPTTTANPGGLVKKFNQVWLPTFTYLNANPIAVRDSGKLDETLSITNLDVEDPGVQGGIPYKPANDPTQYSSLVTGTPTSDQSPAGPAQKFDQVYDPKSTYLAKNPIKGIGELNNTLPITTLDSPSIFNPDPTIYPQLATTTPTTKANYLSPQWSSIIGGGTAKNFSQIYNESTTYLSTNPIAESGSGKLDDTLAITNLDVENPGVKGGIPYEDTNDPTIYPPVIVNHTAPIQGYFSTAGSVVRKFNQVFTPVNTYLSSSVFNVENM